MPPPGPLSIPKLPLPPDVVWRVPGSKSITNRALLLAALAEGTSRLEGVLHSDDTAHMRSALEAMGVTFRELGPTLLEVEGGRRRLRVPNSPLFVGNSGTTVRFLAALACLLDGPVTLEGDESMARRPIQVLVEGLRQLGVNVECASGCPPLTIHGRGLRGGHVVMRGDRSSQYFSALMLAGGLADDEIEIEIQGELVSRPYVEITRRMVADFGGGVEETERGFVVKPVSGYQARAFSVEPDASSASYPFALAAASGGTIRVPGLGVSAVQGDYAFLDLLERLGARVERRETHTEVTGLGRLGSIDCDMQQISDTVMTLAAIAPLCTGPTTIRNVGNIRIKETDRLSATATELRRLGQVVTEGEDWLRVEPRPVEPATVRCYADHRMAMSFAVLGAVHGGLAVEDPACVEKTYPGFFDDLGACYPSAPW
jgi:3-phosphoshikimate 1-carboxyvinyltransferase